MTTGGTVDKRHASTETFDRYLDSHVPVVLPVRGTPEAFVFIEPRKSELGLRVEDHVDVDPPDTRLTNIIARMVVRDGVRFLEVVVTAPELFRDAYPVLCSMADRVQVDGLSPAAALRATLEKMSSLLRSPESMAREREVGLFGELLVVAGLLSVLNPKDAIEAWRGGQAEEHDFGLAKLDIEVKTTTSERRVHWIESLTQLMPTMERPLWLVSHQVTVAGTGNGHTLAELVDIVRAEIGSGGVRGAFDKALSGSGWRQEYHELLTTRWARRSESTAHPVVGEFPRLTPEGLRQGGVPLGRVVDVRYRINLDGLAPHPSTPNVVTTAIGFEG